MPARNRRKWQLVGVAVFSLFLGIILWRHFSVQDDFSSQVNRRQATLGAQEKFQARLYFAASNTDELIVEERSLPKLSLLQARAKLVLKELILGPKQGQLQATIPPQSRLREFYLDEQGCAYLDFEATLRENHPGGSYAELLTIASLVKTLQANFPQIKQIKLLINGGEIETLAGHIDTRFPFSPQNLPLTPLPGSF